MIVKDITAVGARAAGLGALCISACFASVSHAAFILHIDDDLDATNGRTVIFDGDSDGLISYTGGYGNFSVVVTTGVSQPLLQDPAKIDLNSIEVSGSAGTLYIWLTNTDFTAPVNELTADFGGTTQGDVSFEFSYDVANTEFGGSIFASGDSASAATAGTAFSDSISAAVLPASPYSLTIFAEVEHTGGGQVTSFDALVTGTAVPLPAAAWLFGSSALALGAFRARRK